MKMVNAAGAVAIDRFGNVMLRMPTGFYGGYHWTFAKGRVERGEALEAAAARETLEETGWTTKVGKAIGDFAGDTSTTRFFLAEPVEYHGAPGTEETSAVMWVTRERAEAMIAETTSVAGRARDLAVLAAAYAARSIV